MRLSAIEPLSPLDALDQVSAEPSTPTMSSMNQDSISGWSTAKSSRARVS